MAVLQHQAEESGSSGLSRAVRAKSPLAERQIGEQIGGGGGSPFPSGPLSGPPNSSDNGSGSGSGNDDSSGGSSDGGSGSDGSSDNSGDNGFGGNFGPDQSGLSTAAIAGIAVGSILVFFAIVALLVWLCRRGRRGHQQRQQPVLVKDSGAHRLHNPESPLQRERRHHRLSQSEETVAFAKIASTSRVQLPDVHEHSASEEPDEPPAYEESEQRNIVDQYEHLPLRRRNTVEYAMGSVSDGFRGYSVHQPVHDAAVKGSFDALGPGDKRIEVGL